MVTLSQIISTLLIIKVTRKMCNFIVNTLYMFMWWIKILFFFVDDETIDPAGRCRQGDDGG